MRVAFNEGVGGTGSYGFCDQSYEYSYDQSDGVVGRMSGRRRQSDAEKLEILAERSVQVRVCDIIALRQVSSSSIYTWRKQLREGKLAGVVPSLPVFAQVQVVDPVASTPQPAPCPPGFIHIELPDGVRVSVDAHVDAGALARVLSVLW